MLRRFFIDQSGATAIEYALIAALVSVAIIVGLTGMSNSMKNLFGSLQVD